MYLRSLYLTCVLSVTLAGCALGMGPSTAAMRPLLRQTTSNDDATMWVVSSDQSNVPANLNQFRFGIAVAKAWTSADPYSSSGYTYQLVSTMY